MKVTNKAFEMMTPDNEEIFSTLIYVTEQTDTHMICVMRPGTIIIKTETHNLIIINKRGSLQHTKDDFMIYILW